MNELDERVATAWLLACGVQPRDLLLAYYDSRRRTSKLAAADKGLREAREALAFAPVEFFKELAEATGAALSDIVTLFKDSRVVRIFSKVGWSFKKLWALLKTGYQAWVDLQKAMGEYLAGTKVGKWTKDELEKLDAFLETHPKTRKISGAVVGAMLAYMWFKMAFIGDADFDFDADEVVAAFSGSYSLSKIFAGPDGMRMLVALGAGLAGLNFPWPGPGSVQFAVSIVRSLANKIGLRMKHAGEYEAKRPLNWLRRVKEMEERARNPSSERKPLPPPGHRHQDERFQRRQVEKQQLRKEYFGHVARELVLAAREVMGMEITKGIDGLEKSWQQDFPLTTECCRCGGTARIGFVAHEGLTPGDDDAFPLYRMRENKGRGCLWPHDRVAVAVYFCKDCLETTALYNQA